MPELAPPLPPESEPLAAPTAPATSRAPTRATWAILVASLLLHAAFAWIGHGPPPRRLVDDEWMYLGVADKLARGQPPGENPLWPPLYGRAIAPLVTPTDDELRMPASLQLVQVGLHWAAGFLLRDLTLAWTGSTIAAELCFAFLLLDPQLASYAHFALAEMLHLTFFLGLLKALALPRISLWAHAAAGFLLGLALLTKSILQLLVPWLVWAAIRAEGWRTGSARIALVLAGAAVVVAPVMLENHRVHGVAMIADSSLFNLWVGLRDKGGRPLHVDDTWTCYLRYMAAGDRFVDRQRQVLRWIHDEWARRGTAALFLDLLGRQYFRLFDRRSLLAEQYPGGALHAHARGYRWEAYPAHRGLRILELAFYALVLAAAGHGLVHARSRGHPWLIVMAGFLVSNLALFLVLHAMPRFRIQFLPCLYLAAAIGLAELAGRLPPGSTRPRRPLLTLATSGLLLFFAFGTDLVHPPR